MGKIKYDEYGLTASIVDDDFSAHIMVDKQNQRIKLLSYGGHTDKLAQELMELGGIHNMGKIICVVPEKDAAGFINADFIVEGKIEGFFKGEDGLCVSCFTNKERAFSNRVREEDEILRKSLEYNGNYVCQDNHLYKIRTATEDDIDNIAEIFTRVFKTYPTPMDKPGYIKEIMNNKVLFKVAERNGQIISVASADMNTLQLNAEITDCATLQEYRGKGLLSDLIYELEQELVTREYIVLYSLSRALSVGVNIVFSKHGYSYEGRQINNCNIMGKFEDMNLWVKKLR